MVSQAIKERNIRKSLELKYYVLHRFAGYVNIKNSIKSLIREEQEPITNSVLIDFGYKTLLHTLAHFFILYLVTQKGVEQDDVLYFVDVENACIHVLEASKNDGLGLVETIKNQLEKGEENNLLEDFYNNAKEFLVTHDEKVGRFEQELTKEAKEKLENVQNIKELIDLVEETNDELGEWLEYIDTPSYRECLVSNLRKELYEMSEYWLASVFYPDTHVHLCADGCNECLVFQTGCHAGFMQRFSLSRQLAKFYLDRLVRRSLSISSNGVGELLTELFERAEEIYIKVPFIDETGSKIISELVRKGKVVNVITRADSAPKLGEVTSLKKSEDLHSKEFLVVNGNSVVKISGSANLTRTSLFDKVENIFPRKRNNAYM